jgi:hypothetical protein
VDDTIAGPVRSGARQLLLDTAVRYTEERRWEVLAGAWLEPGPAGTPVCSCAAASCPAPGAHPAEPDWAAEVCCTAAAVQRAWNERPRASILLPTGRAFDVVEVSESAGFHALARLERQGLPLGPVLCTPSWRMAFFVLPGSSARTHAFLERMGWPAIAADVVVRGQGDWVVAPPTCTLEGCAQWARRPSPVDPWLPDCGEVLGALAYACARA